MANYLTLKLLVRTDPTLGYPMQTLELHCYLLDEAVTTGSGMGANYSDESPSSIENAL